MKARKTLAIVALLLTAALSACTSTSVGSSDGTDAVETTTEAASDTSTAGTSSGVAATAASDDSADTSSGGVITDMVAPASGGGVSFDGTLDHESDLGDLVETAWGDGSLGLHRGHMPIENVLVAFLGISHEEMHVYMEEQGMNLAAVAEGLGLDPENLIESLTYSFLPYIEQGVDNGVITEDEVDTWTEQVRQAFSDRIYWEG